MCIIKTCIAITLILNMFGTKMFNAVLYMINYLQRYILVTYTISYPFFKFTSSIFVCCKIHLFMEYAVPVILYFK